MFLTLCCLSAVSLLLLIHVLVPEGLAPLDLVRAFVHSVFAGPEVD